ncbi:unnamed protein product [Musa acuminata subsp. burmannicoides]
MATVVAGDSSSLNPSFAIQEAGSRNKRKFHADLPLVDSNALADALQTELPNFDLFPAEQTTEIPSLEHHEGECDMCRTHMFGFKEGPELDEFQDVDWSCLTESQLEEILLDNLDVVFMTAIKMITSHGYTKEVATSAVLSSGLCYGYKDSVSNVVDNALALLRRGQQVDSSSKENISKNLKELEKRVLAEMISVLRGVRPFISTGEALWCLLMSDANVTHACAMDSSSSNAVISDEYLGTSVAAKLESGSESNDTIPVSSKSNVRGVIPCSDSAQQSEPGKMMVIPSLPHGKFSASNENDLVSKPKAMKESLISSSNHVGESSSSILSRSPQEEKSVSGKKVHVGCSKKGTVQHRSVHVEKSYRPLGTKAVSRACRQSGSGSLIMDRKCKQISDATSISLKSSSLKPGEATGTEKSFADANLNLSFSHGYSSSSTGGRKEVTSRSMTPTTDTELSLSLSSGSSIALSPTQESNVDAPNCGSNGMIHSGTTFRDWIPEDKKDEMLLILVPLMRELQVQLQDWSDWAQEKVMQAARRLSKEKVELQILRQEKEEAACLQKERQTLEENTRKKLAEMELAISKASAQVERANAAARRLEFENTQLRLGMEAAKLHAAQSEANCQEASRREMKTLKMFQSWEKQQIMFQEELANERHQLSQLQQQLEQVKELQDQSEARWRQEEKMKNEALAEISAERNEREQIETSAKSQENALRLKAENDLQRCKSDIRRLEQQIAQLRQVTNLSILAAPRWGTERTYACRLLGGSKNINANILADIMDSQDSASEELQRERECVMCLSEEMSVVFLPCAHQVVCTKCNELHEKQAMKDCPSCRTPIQRRVSVRLADR